MVMLPISPSMGQYIYLEWSKYLYLEWSKYIYLDG